MPKQPFDRIADIQRKKALREAKKALREAKKAKTATPTTTQETAEMARKRKTESSPPNLTPEQRNTLILEGYGSLYTLESDIAKLMEEHIKPLQKRRTSIWRGLKKDTAVDTVDLDNGYRVFKRDKLANEMGDADGERIKNNMRIVFGALSDGETLDWIKAAEIEDRSDAFERAAQGDALGDDAEHDDEVTGGPSEIAASASDGEPAPESEPEPAAPDADWAAAAAADDANFDNAGHAFNEATEAGANAFHVALGVDANPYPADSVLAKAWTRGFMEASDASGVTASEVEHDLSGGDDVDDAPMPVPVDGAEVVHLHAAQ